MRKSINTVPFNRDKIPPKQNILVMPLLWLWCFVATRSGHLKINKVRFEGLKPPFLVLGTHHSFMDFYVSPLALFPHRANYVSELEGFEAYGEWKYRQIGCLGTRKFVNDLALVKNIKRVMNRKGILVLYPEARYANVGTSSKLPPSVGKLCKYLNVPIVTINMKGNYLQSPIWNLKKRKGVKLETTITQLFTAEEIKCASEEEIQEALGKSLYYDEYKWQKEAGIKIKERFRAEGLHLPLYQCKKCNEEFVMDTKGTRLFCKNCGASWELDENGDLMSDSGGSIQIPEWYEWQRQKVKEEIDEQKYAFNCRVHIEALPNAVNFIDLGEGTLKHTESGFTLNFKDYGEAEYKTLQFTSRANYSIHTEYDYRGKGQCVTLSTQDNTYFLFPIGEGFNATKIQFATEYLWEKVHNRV